MNRWRSRGRRLVLAGAVVAVCAAVALYVASRPARVSGFVLAALGDALGLDITATGTAEYRLLAGSPMLVVRNVAVREPGAATPLLRAQRVLVSVPWSTVRSRGAQLAITRIELDAPILDVAALRHWLGARPSGASTLPTLSDGLRITGGRVTGADWRVDGLALNLPILAPDRRVDARASGRIRADALAATFDLAIAMTRPANGAGVAIVGSATAEGEDWQLPARLSAAGRMRLDRRGLRVPRLRASLAGRYRAGATELPFVFAIASPLRARADAIAFAPAGIALRGDGVVPRLDAGGAFAFGERLLLRLDGRIPAWSAAWPALPSPLSQATAPLAVSVRYLGATGLSDPIALRVRRDDTRFDGALRVRDVAAWMSATTPGSPLPPLSGRLSTPRLEISGMQLEGVDVELHDDDGTVATPRAQRGTPR